MLKDKEEFDSVEMMEQVLKTAPDFMLSAGFADNVVQKVKRQFAWEQYFKEFLIYLSAVAGLAVLSGGMAFLWLKSSWQEWLQFISGNVELVVGVNVLLIFILFADRVLLRYFFYRFSNKSGVFS